MLNKHCGAYKDENTNCIFNELIILCNRQRISNLKRFLKIIWSSPSPLSSFNLFYNIPIEQLTKLDAWEDPSPQLTVSLPQPVTQVRNLQSIWIPCLSKPSLKIKSCKFFLWILLKYSGPSAVLPQPLFRLNYFSLPMISSSSNLPTSCHHSFFLRQIWSCHSRVFKSLLNILMYYRINSKLISILFKALTI